MYILGINSAYHESSACLIKSGKIIAGVEEERFTRRKHAKSARVDNPDELPLNAIHFCLNTAAGIGMGDVERIGYSINPKKRFENKDFDEIVVENDWGSASGEEEFFRRLYLVPEKLRELGFKGEFTFLDHHQCHAASAFYPSPFSEAAVLTVDGIGETASTAFFHGKKNKLKKLKETLYPASIGFLWEKVCKYLGFTEYDACKVMGLAAYGDARRFLKEFERVVKLKPYGSFEISNDVFRFRVEDCSGLEELFSLKRRNPEHEIEQEHKDIAASLQFITNEAVIHMVNYIYEQTRSTNLCMAGGVALNCVTNRMVFEDGPFQNLYIQPAAHDGGTAIGAALYIWNSILNNEYRDVMDHAYYGPSFSESEIEQALKENNLMYERVDNIERIVAGLLSRGYVVGWFQGAVEMGPRALGNRSLLADPRNPNMREILNVRIKHREGFRPFAPSVLYEEAGKWFQINKPAVVSDFMMMSYAVKDCYKDVIPAVIHVDNTSRIQTVKEEVNSKYYRLISEFFKITGVPLVLNTSFNDGEPIVCSPRDAIMTFLKSGIDYLAIGDFLVERTDVKRTKVK